MQRPPRRLRPLRPPGSPPAPTAQRIAVRRARPAEIPAPELHRAFRGREVQPRMVVTLVGATVVLSLFDLYLLGSLIV